MDQRGIAPSPAAVRTMASLLASQHSRPVTAGKNWVYAFINRHDELKSKFNRKYDYKRALCQDPELNRAWFRRVQSTITQFGILLEDIYNFDETGFQMGVISTSKVITTSDRKGRLRTKQLGNRKWVTAIEAVNARG